MFKKDRPKHKRMIETELEHTLVMLNGVSPDSDEYAKKLTTAERLQDMLYAEVAPSISRDTIVNVVVNLAGILIIIRHENVNFIASKALGFVRHLK